MGFNGGGSGGSSIATSSDVALNNVANTNLLGYDSVLGKWKNVVAGSGSLSAAVIIPENYGVIADGTTDNTSAWTTVVDAAHTQSKPIWVTGRYRGTINASNKNLTIFGPGTLIHAAGDGPVIRASHTPGTRVTVTSIAQNFIVSPDIANPSSTYVTSAITVAPSALNQFVADDVWTIASDDGYSWNDDSPVGGTLKAGQVPIAGVIFTASYTDGAIKENDTVVGTSSGATALVGSVARINTSTGQLVTKSITGTFTNGESLTVSGAVRGTINAAGAVLMHGELDDTYTTNPVLRKLRADLELTIDGLGFDVTGDPDGLVGTANRKTLIELKGVIKPIIKDIRVYNSWATACKLTSCYRPVVDNMWMGRGANNATTGPSASNQPSEQGYGYGIEITGTTYGGSFQINGGMMRHAFTTNPTSHSAGYVAGNDEAWMNIGTCRHNIVHDSTVVDNWAAGFDTHEGAQNTTFINCINKRTMGAARRFSGMTGFNNRSHNTSYIDCRDEGSAEAFNDSSRHHTITSVSTTRYENCVADNYQSTGFRMSQPDMDSFHRAEYVNCRARGDGRALNAPYAQVGFLLRASNSILRQCISERFNNSGLTITTSSTGDVPTVIIDGMFFDFRDTPNTTASAIRSNATVNLHIIQKLKILQNPGATSMPSATIIVTGGSPTVRVAGDTVNVAGSTVIPIISGATASTVTGY